jgi:hypothetical protein
VQDLRPIIIMIIIIIIMPENWREIWKEKEETVFHT